MNDAISLSFDLQKELLGENFNYHQIPWLSLPPGYSFKVIFPFSGAVARFLARKDEKPYKTISVYLDWKCNLGNIGGNPYWEAYPIEDDCARFALNETEELIAAIVKELDQ